MATAKSRSLNPMLTGERHNWIFQFRLAWQRLVAAFIMEEPQEYAFHPDLAVHLDHREP